MSKSKYMRTHEVQIAIEIKVKVTVTFEQLFLCTIAMPLFETIIRNGFIVLPELIGK